MWPAASLLDRCADDIYGGHPGRDLAQERGTDIGPLRKLIGAPGAAAPVPDDNPAARARRLRASLAIARGFVEANGGRISVESTSGQGTTFVVELPITNGVP